MSDYTSDYEHGRFDFNRLDEQSKGYAGDDLVGNVFSYIDWLTGEVENVKAWKRGFGDAFTEHQENSGY